jgi:hypothetical protein
MKCSSCTECLGNFCLKFLGNAVPSAVGIHEHSVKVWSTGSLLDKEPVEKFGIVTEEKLHEGGG